MPREVLDISTFDRGIISSPDIEDTPLNAASYSEDVDGDVSEGKLVGRPVDTVISTAFGLAADIGGTIVEDDGKLTLVYQNAISKKLSSVYDVVGTPVAKDLLSPLSHPITTMALHNKEIHVGLGAFQDARPLWIGKPSVKQFGKTPTGELIVENAEVSFSNITPFLHKIVVDATYIYGFEFQGDTLYKITRSSGVVTKSEPGAFVRIQAISDDDPNDVAQLMVYDAGVGTYGIILNVSKSDFTKSNVITLTALPIFDGGIISDMMTTAGRIWLAAYAEDTSSMTLGNDNFVSAGNFIFRVNRTIGNTSLPAIAATPRFQSTGFTTAGNWVTQAGAAASMGITALFPLSLIRISGSYIGVATTCQKILWNTSGEVVYMDSTSTKRRIVHAIHMLPETQIDNAPASIWSFDLSSDSVVRGLPRYNGFYYDGVINGDFYYSRGTTLYKKASVTPTNGVGDYEDVTGPTSVQISLGGAICAKSTTLFITRSNGISGVDKITTALASYAEEYSGGSIGLTVIDNATTDVFLDSRKYYYKAAFQYDGYQHSPLSSVSTAAPISTNGKQITIDLTNIDELSTRISHILLFKASGPVSGGQPDSFYRLVKAIATDDFGWVISGVTASFVVQDDLETTGSAYESLSGMPETLPDSMVNYTLSAAVNGYLFVANCFHTSLPDASHMIFRSKIARFDMFDWSTDFIKLPIVPTAIVGYAGRLFVFDEVNTYKINPDGMYIEDRYEGIGCLSPRSVVVTERGMFYCDRNNIYAHDGRTPIPIGEPIRVPNSSTNSIGWTSAGHTNHKPVLGYLARKEYVVIAVSDVGGRDLFFVFNIAKKRWDLWTVPAGGINVGLIPIFNDLYWSQADALYNLAAHPSTKMPVVWYSGDLTMGDPSQIKRLYKIILRGTGSQGCTYALDSTEVYNSLSGSAPNYDIIPVGTLGRTIRLRLSLLSGNNKLNSASIIFRPLVGKR